LTEGLGLTDAGTKLSEDIDWKRQRAATTGQKKVRWFLLAVRRFRRKRKRRRRLCLVVLECLISSSHIPWLVHSCLYYWTYEMMQQGASLQLKRKCLPFKWSLFVSSYFCKFFINISFLLGQNRLSGTAVRRLWEKLSRLTSARLISPVSEPPMTSLLI
jgi:hypothetical protein